MAEQNGLRRIWETGGREGLTAAVRDRLADLSDAMKARLFNPPHDGLAAEFEHAEGIDRLLSELCSVAFRNAPFPFALCAVGGYARGELAPYSDIDLLFLIPDGAEEALRGNILFLLCLLWDSGLKVGYSVGTPEERIAYAGTDFKTRTAFLETRFICGDGALFSDFSARYEILRETSDKREFLEAKLAERAERLKKTGGSKYMLEPNVKEGRGGLRDLHLLFWLAKYFYGVTEMYDLVDRNILTPATVRRFLKAHGFLATVRCYLHFSAGKAGDVLTLEAQKEIAERTGYARRTGSAAVERFMKHYYLVSRKVGELSELILSIIEDRAKGADCTEVPAGDDAFVLRSGRLDLKDATRFETDPSAILRAFLLKDRLDAPFSPHLTEKILESATLLRSVRKTPQIRRLFFDILTGKHPESVLRRMNETGVLGVLIPAFVKITGQVQFDLYHVYTTDEHTFKTVGFLRETAENSPSGKVLLTAGLLHDIAKGQGGDHAAKGAVIAKTVCEDLGLNGEETDAVVRLVANHLLMSHTAFKRDVFDPKTAEDFVAEVQSPEHLRLLYALTEADIRAVGPNVWNGFKEQLLKTLFDAALERMQGSESRPRPLRPAQKKLAELPPSRETSFAVEHDGEKGVTELTVRAPDRNGLFALITGVLAVEGVSVAEAQIVTLPDKTALDSFLIQDVDPLDPDVRRPVYSEKKIKRIQEKIRSADTDALERELAAKRKKTARKALWSPPRVMIDNTASDFCSLIEINGTDAVGFLHAVTRAMTLADLKIVSAHVYTYGSKVVDVFYVTDRNDNKITNAGDAARIKTFLLDTIDGFAQFAG